jgi:hypothetical protein
VWDGAGHAYIIGGTRADGTLIDEIVRYTPGALSLSDDTVTVLSSHLPQARAFAGAAWDGASAHLFGGSVAGAYSTSDVLRFTPSTGAITNEASLPMSLTRAPAVWDAAGNAYVVGGYGSGGSLATVVRFTPSTQEAVALSAAMPEARSDAAAVWDGDSVYALGGFDGYDTLGDVVRHSLVPGAPQNLTALPTGTEGQIGLSWSPPPAATHGALAAYAVYRAPTSSGPFVEVARIPATTTAFVDRHLRQGLYVYEVTAVAGAADEGPASATATSLAFDTQNDAGQGIDAGNSEADATQIAVVNGGQFTGRLVPAIDPADVFGFALPASVSPTCAQVAPPAGEDVRVALVAPSGARATSDHGGAGSIESACLPSAAGTWMLDVELVTPPATAAPGVSVVGTDYTVSVST